MTSPSSTNSSNIQANFEPAKELETYALILTKAIAKNSSEIIPNSGEMHAALMMEKLFSVTRSKVNMIVNDFNGKVSDQDCYVESLTNFLKKDNIELSVIILGDVNVNSRSYNILLENKKSGKNINIAKANESTIEYIKSAFASKDLTNFSVFDDNKYRLEISPKTYSAFGCFNDSGRASKLNEIFNNASATLLN